MKIIHTSDWHLGQELHSYDRTEEHTAFLEQLSGIVANEQPDALIVSGDIYHNATPSNTVMRMFTDQMDRIRRACPNMQTVVIAGNHDSPSRLEISATVWNHLGVHIIGRIERQKDDTIDFHRHIIPINGKGFIVALPHVFPQNYPLTEEGIPREERQHAFMQAMDKIVKEMNIEKLPVVVAAHLAITGSETQGHDLTRGGMDFVETSELGIDYDYLALGHIHCPQNIENGKVRYCGSPYPVSFDESYPHSVSVVEINATDETPNIRTIHINNPWPLRTIPKKAVPFDEAIEMLTTYPSDEKAYIRLHVQIDTLAPPNALEKAHQATKEKAARFCCFKWVRDERKDEEQRTTIDVEQIKQLTPVEIADRYHQDEFGKPLDNELKNMLEDIVKQNIEKKS